MEIDLGYKRRIVIIILGFRYFELVIVSQCSNIISIICTKLEWWGHVRKSANNE